MSSLPFVQVLKLVGNETSIEASLANTFPYIVRNHCNPTVQIMQERLKLAATLVAIDEGMGLDNETSTEESIESAMQSLKEEASNGIFLSDISYWMAVEFKRPGALNLLYCPLCPLDKNFENPFAFEVHFNENHNALYRNLSCPVKNCEFTHLLKPKLVTHMQNAHNDFTTINFSHVLMKAPSRLGYTLMANMEGSVVFPTGRLCRRQNTLPESAVPLQFDPNTRQPIDPNVKLIPWRFLQVSCKDTLVDAWPKPLKTKKQCGIEHNKEVPEKRMYNDNNELGNYSFKRNRSDTNITNPEGICFEKIDKGEKKAAVETSQTENTVPPQKVNLYSSFPDAYRNFHWNAVNETADESLNWQSVVLASFCASSVEFRELVRTLEKVDILCIQNCSKISPTESEELRLYRKHCLNSMGLSGLATYSKLKPLCLYTGMDILSSESEKEAEARMEFNNSTEMITTEFTNFILFHVEAPGNDEATTVERIEQYAKGISIDKPFIITGTCVDRSFTALRANDTSNTILEIGNATLFDVPITVVRCLSELP